MVDGESFIQREKLRLCPSCRMEIPVLAVKCRFCGEEVGRPKEEARQLTITDLGGESGNHYAPSGNVMDALEAFRAEMMAENDSAEDEKIRRSGRSRRKGKEGAGQQPGFKSDHPEIEPDNDFLASIGVATPKPRRQAVAHSAQPTWMKKVAYLGSFVAVVVILVVGGVKVAGAVQQMIWPSHTESGSTFHNRAPEIMREGGAPIDALAAAAEALDKDNSAKNKEIAEQAVGLVGRQVEDLLNDPDWKPEDLQKASELAHRASSLYPSNLTRQMRENVQNETFAYQISLFSSDPDAKVATLNVTMPNGTRERVKVSDGDTVNGRFIVRNIWKDRVTLEDTKRLAKHDRSRTVSVDMTGISPTA